MRYGLDLSQRRCPTPASELSRWLIAVRTTIVTRAGSSGIGRVGVRDGVAQIVIMVLLVVAGVLEAVDAADSALLGVRAE